MRDLLRSDWAPRAVHLTVEHLGNTAEARKRNRAGKSQTVFRGTRNKDCPSPGTATRATARTSCSAATATSGWTGPVTGDLLRRAAIVALFAACIVIVALAAT